jgi:hypothetical protein
MKIISSSCLAAMLALCTFAWTGIGESAYPELLAAELPLNIVSECETSDACQGAQNFVSRWVSRSSRGDLFIVQRATCTSGACGSWFVEKTAAGPVTRLTLEGGFRLISNKNTAYPDVQMQRRISDNQTSYVHYSWTGDHYVKTETRDTYHVNGVECGNRDECYLAAVKANQAQRPAQAIQIMETVHGLAWI